jgi:phosphoribosylaminoimidazole carboxylase (NCAIR synthetase)
MARQLLSLFQLEQLKRQHQEEMADLVRQHNKKYSDMLAQRMNEEDALKLELEKLHQSLIDAIKQEHKTSVQRLTSQCEAERLARQEVTADRDLLERKFESLAKATLEQPMRTMVSWNRAGASGVESCSDFVAKST